MRGEGEGLGPPLDPRPHGPPDRGVHAAPPKGDGQHADRLSSVSVPEDERDVETPVLHLADRAHFRVAKSFNLNAVEKPLLHPTFRHGTVVPLQRLPGTATGKGYMNHVPLTTRVHVNSCTDTPLSSLLDTGASLSTIDAGLLARLGGTPQGPSVVVKGLGTTQTLGYVTVTFFIEARDRRDKQVFLECSHDLHVLPSFAPGLCLGRDFIDGHDISLSPARGRARIGAYTFRISEQVEGPYTTEAELCVAEDVELPAETNVWVPIDASCLAPGVDYVAHPRLSITPDERVRLAGPTGIITHDTRRHILLGNFGAAPFRLEKGTKIADAVAAHVGDIAETSSHMFTLRPTPPTSVPHLPSPVPSAFPITDPADPIDAFEAGEDRPVEPTHDCATTMVDDHFKVGVDAAGQPPPEIVETLRRHHDAFALDGRPGLVAGTEMEINLVPDASLRPEPPRRASPEKRAAMDAAIDQLLDWNVIEESASPISFPVLMVRQYAKWRFCVDYRQLNASTVADRYPLPTIDSVFQTLSGKRVFSSLDAIRGYHQLPVRESDRWKTAFVCHRGLFQYRTVPFGLRNAPAVFQRLMDRILGALRWQDAVVYIDDVVVATRDLATHAQALDILLTEAKRHGLKFSPTKCTFAVRSLVLLGRKVSGAGVAVWADRASAVRDLARPTTLRELYHALGLFGYYRAFIPDYARAAAPLTDLTKGWRYEQADGRYRLVNSEGKAVTADRVPIEWGTRQQDSFERLKSAIAEPPTLAHPDPSRPYLLYVDASTTGFAAILHQIHDADDTPPAQSTSAGRLHALDVASLPPDIAKERWVAWLRRDRHFAPILRDAELVGDTASDDAEWQVAGDVLVRRGDGRVALPEAALPDVLRHVHDQGGHFGFYKTFLAVARDFWRPGLATSVRAWVKHCRTCQRSKLARKTGSLDVENDPSLPFETISVDLILGLPRSRVGNDAVLAILDVFSRMILLEPCASTITAEGIAAVISNRVLRYGWRPRRLVSDSEPRMTGAVMTALAQSLRAELTPSSPYHQQANSVERAIQTVQRTLRTMTLPSRAHWDRRAVPSVELAMNSTPSVVTGHRPFDMVFISHPSIVHAVFDADEHLGVGSFVERLAAAGERLEEACRSIAAARRVQKRRYDRLRARPVPLEVGDEVFLRLGDRPIPGLGGGKLDARKAGPFRVEEVLSPHRVRLALPDDVAIDPEVNIEQLDVVPQSPDPFIAFRNAEQETPEGSADRQAFAQDEASEHLPSLDEAPDAPAAPRARRPPQYLHDFDFGVLSAEEQQRIHEALREPIRRPRVVDAGTRKVTLVERPVAFLSRLTQPAEKKMVAAELELCCLAWAFAKLAHLLEGAEVTVITDHASMGAMLSSTTGVSYGPTISRCRALLMPHMPNLRFVVKAGSSHTNADALSRLPRDPGRSTSLGGDVL